MSELQNTSSGDKGEGSGIFDAMPPDVALKTLSNLQLEDSRIVAPLKDRSRLANQVYDLLQSFLTGTRVNKETYYPSLEDIHGDLQMHKRAISDKTPMPSRAELLRTICLMSVQAPPFLHILREIPQNAETPQFITRLVAPTEKHADKVSVGYRATLRNNLVNLKAMLRQLEPDLPGGPAFNRIQDVNPRTGRVETILGNLFFHRMADAGDSPPPTPEELKADEVTLKRVNQSLRIKLFRPLIMDLIREKVIFSISCQDIRQQTGQKIPDIVLFNILENVEHRFTRLCEILTHEAVLSLAAAAARQNAERFLHSGHLKDAAETVAHDILETAGKDIPFHLIEIAAEMIKLRQWYDEKSRAHKQDQQKQEIHQILQKIKGQKGIFRAKNGRKINIDEKYLNLLLNETQSPVLVSSDPPLARSGVREASDYETIYLLYKDRTVTGAAIQTALDSYKKTDDAFLLRLLEDLLQINTKSDQELKDYVAPAYLEQMREAIRDSYRAYLSPLERIWLALTGKRISDAKILKIRRKLDLDRSDRERAATEKKKAAARTRAKKEVRTVARERAKSGPIETVEPVRESSAGFDHEAQEVLSLLLTQVNNMWDRGFYPGREQVLQMASANEKEIAEKVLGLVDAGAQSTAAMIRIPVPGKGYVYAGHDYVHGNKQELIDKFKRKLEAGSAVQVSGGHTLQLSTKEEDRMFYRAMLQYLNHI